MPQARREAAPLGARFRYAALATRILLGIQVATSVVGTAAYLRIAAQLGAGATPAETAQGVDAAGRLLTVTTIGELILLLVTAVLWCAWQVILARSDLIHVGDLRRSVGWHLASWIVPFVSLWLPLQNVADLDAAAQAVSLYTSRCVEETAHALHTTPVLKAVLIALREGAALAEHNAPPAATLQCLVGQARLHAGSREWPLGPGSFAPIPPERHGVDAVSDCVLPVSYTHLDV